MGAMSSTKKQAPAIHAMNRSRTVGAPYSALDLNRLGLGDQIVQIGGLESPGLLEDDLPLLHHHQRGNRLDAGGLRKILIGVDVDLAEHDVAVLGLIAQKSTKTRSLPVMVCSKSAEES